MEAAFYGMTDVVHVLLMNRADPTMYDLVSEPSRKDLWICWFTSCAGV